jgi:hypothetical protein
MTEILLRTTHFADEPNHWVKPLATANYSSAIAKAVEWLGDRYLLAKPINAAPGRVIRTGLPPEPRTLASQ